MTHAKIFLWNFTDSGEMNTIEFTIENTSPSCHMNILIIYAFELGNQLIVEKFTLEYKISSQIKALSKKETRT